EVASGASRARRRVPGDRESEQASVPFRWRKGVMVAPSGTFAFCLTSVPLSPLLVTFRIEIEARRGTSGRSKIAIDPSRGRPWRQHAQAELLAQIEAAKGAIGEAERELSTALAQLEVSARADKQQISTALEGAFRRLDAAQKTLAVLERSVREEGDP